MLKNNQTFLSFIHKTSRGSSSSFGNKVQLSEGFPTENNYKT